MQEEDRALVRRTCDGDLSAFEDLVRRYQSRVCRTLYFLLPDKQDIDDVAQEVFIRVFRHLTTFRWDCEFSTWLHRITLNTLRNWKRSKRPCLSLEAAAEKGYLHPRTEPADAHLLSTEEALEVRKALAALPGHYREALVLRHFHQLSYEDVAEIQRVPIGTVRSRLAKGRQMLFERLTRAGIIEASERTVAT